MTLPKGQGGLQMMNITLFLRSSKTVWLRHFYQQSETPCSNLYKATLTHSLIKERSNK